MPRIAFYTFGILHETIGHPRVQEFVDRIPSTFTAARETEGFIARSDHSNPELSWGNIRDVPRFYDSLRHPPEPSTPKTISLWKDLASVYSFAYQGLHLEALQKRKEWFQAPEWPTYVAWWVGDDEVPTYEDGARKLEQLLDNGATPAAFNFKQPFDSEGNSIPPITEAVRD